MNRKLRNLGSTGTLVAGLTSPLQAQDIEQSSSYDNSIESVDTSLSLTEDSKSDLKGFLSSSIDSKYHADGGFVLSDGPVNQTFLKVSVDDVVSEGDSLSGFVWSNYDFNQRNFSEVDFGLEYSTPITENLNGSLELALWDFPSESILPNHVVALRGRLNYSGPIDLNLRATNVVGNGREFVLTGSKIFDIGSVGDADLTVKPYVSTAFMDNFFDLNGFTNVQVGASLEAELGDSTLITGYVEYQKGLMDGFDDGLVGGVKVSFGF